MAELLVMNTPAPDDYRIVKIFGLVTGLTARTRGIGGKFVAGLEAMAGGEVTAFTSEMEKARFEAIERMKEKAVKLGANAVVGVDIETSEVYAGIVLVSATGTAMVVEKTK
jgi:uncharacterized protein YbjQ (UPF0145 family)